MLIRGLYTALITPFDPQGQLDEEGLRSIIQSQINQGVDGIVLLGTTGETPTLSPEEKKRIIKIGVEEAKNKVSIIVGTGCYATDRTIHETQMAKEWGADAALVVSPYYNKPTPEGLYRHFKALNDDVQFPICVYNIQSRTGQNIHTDTLKRIATLPHIVGVKEGSGNISQMDEVIQTFRAHPTFSILSGDDSFTFPLMALGGHGVISVVSNLVPKPMKELIKACSSGNLSLARTLHQQLSFLFHGAFIETNPIPIKAAMQLCGMASGPCRLPLCELTIENKKKIQEVVNRIPREWL